MKTKNIILIFATFGLMILSTSCETNKERKHEHHSGNPSHQNHKTVPNN